MPATLKVIIATIIYLCLCLTVTAQTIDAQSNSPFNSSSNQSFTLPSDQSVSYVEKTNQAARLCNEGNALRQDGKLQEARTKLEQACLFDPNHNSAAIHSNLGLTLLDLGEIDLARNEFFKALSFNSDMPSALYSIGNCYFQQGNKDKAAFYLQDFLNKYPDGKNFEAAKRMLVSLQNTTQLQDDPNTSDYYISAITNKPTKWSLQNQPIKVFIDSGKNIDGYQPSFQDDLMSAFDKWINASNHLLSWELVSKKKKADIVCHWASDRKDFRQPNGAELGETISKSFPDSTNPNRNLIQSADMALCIRNLDGTKILNDEQMNYLCLHEVGHALGIKSHSSNNNDIMFFMMKSHVSTDLSNRDKATILHLYSSY